MNNAKEYLAQAFYIDKQIKSKMEQLEMLRGLAATTTQPVSDMPGSPNRNTDKMEKVIIKIVDMENKIGEEVERLLALKAELAERIKSVDDIDCKLVLEFRYLCFMSWEEIATEMNCTVRNIHVLHGKALRMIKIS